MKDKNTQTTNRNIFFTISLFSALLFLWFAWGYNFLVIKISLPFIGAYEFAVYRTALSFAFLAVALVLLGRLRLPKKNIKLLILLGLLQTSGFTGFTCLALVSGGTGKTAILAFTNPVWVVILSFLFHAQKIGFEKKVAVILATVGTIMLVQFWDNASPRESYVYALLAGLSLAGSSLVTKALHARGESDIFHVTLWQLLFGVLPLLIGMMLQNTGEVEFNKYVIFSLSYNVFTTVIGWSLWVYILKYIAPSTANINTLAIPVIGILSGYLHLNEIITLLDLAGMLLIGIAITLSWVNLRNDPEAKQTTKAQ